MRKAPFLYFLPYLLVMLAFFAALNPLWLRDLPALALYGGELSFSGERAYVDLQTLVTHFPGRATGSQANQASAQWMADRFRQMGLETRMEFFETLAPENIWEPGFLFRPMQNTHRQMSGTNVLAFSQGRSPSVVLFLAHRDILQPSTRTAADHASGSAVLLELARVLAQGDHFYSYLFVSTDAQESGRQGARYLALFHPDLSLRLAVAVDNLAAPGDAVLSPYTPGSSRQPAPLWTMAMAQQVMASQGLEASREGSAAAHPVMLLYALLSQRGLGGQSHSETEVFAERGDAVLGVETRVKAGAPGIELPAFARPRPGTGEGDIPHGMSRSVPAALGMAGLFIEQYVRSLELNRFDESLLARDYVILPGRYLPPHTVRLFEGLILAAFACLVVLPFLYPVVKWRMFKNFLDRDFPWLAQIGGLALAAGLVWLAPLLAWMRVLPPVVFLIIMAFIVVAGGARLVRRRQYFLRLWHFDPTVANQRRLLVLLLAGFFVAYSLVASSFAAAGMVFLPFLVWSVARFRHVQGRKRWLFLFGAWTVLHGLAGSLVLLAALSDTAPWTLPGLLTFALNAALWLVILVYVFSTPPLGVIERR